MNRARVGQLAGWVLVGLVLLWGWNESRLVDGLRGDVANLTTALADLSTNYEALREAADTNAPPADEIVDDAGADPPAQTAPVVVTQEVTPEQVSAAVAAYCAPRDGCRGANGTGPTQADVLAAVTAYCASGACTGPGGEDGTDGEDGPPPTAEDIAAAVAAYCADGDCQGEKGDTGDTGADGQPVKSFTFTFLGMAQTCTDPDGDGDYRCEAG